MLSRVLFASLRWFPDLLPNDFPLVCLIFSDSFAQHGDLVFVEFGVVHVFIPMLLDTALRSRRK